MLWIGSGRFDGRIGDGNGPRACRGPDAGIEADGKVRPRVPTRVEKPQAQVPVAHNYDRNSLQRSASRSLSEPL